MTPSPLVLVLNSGSSSLKYQLIEPDSGASLADGIVEQIGEPSSGVADHCAALQVAFDKLSEEGIDLNACGLAAVGHRVVHGGAVFYRPTVIDDAVIAELKQVSILAPLHNPPAIEGIEVARTMLPDVPHVAVFDTAFFHDLPAAAATYAIDSEACGEVAYSPLRISRDLASLRQPTGRGFLVSAMGEAESDCAASG